MSGAFSPCPFCAQDGRSIGRGGFTELVCPACGFTWQDPVPSTREAANVYSVDPYWWLHDGRGHEPEFAHLLRHIERRVRAGRLLDVGCGLGGMLGVAQDRGWVARGVDVNPRSVAAAERR